MSSHGRMFTEMILHRFERAAVLATPISSMRYALPPTTFSYFSAAYALFMAVPDIERVTIVDRDPFDGTITVVTPGYVMPDHARKALWNMKPAGIHIEYSDEVIP